ncbi:MAG: alpha-1,2-fucosyltransferase [Fibrobacterales bacterium]
MKLLKIIKYLIGSFKLNKQNIGKFAIVMVDGGLCSTMVKYTLGKYVEKRTGLKIKYDLTWFNENGMDCDKKFSRSFELSNLFPNLDFEIATSEEIQLYKKYFHVNNEYPYIYNDKGFMQNTPMYIDGYYEHWKYLECVNEELHDTLNLDQLELNQKNKDIVGDIKMFDESIAIHIRRGDFVSLGLCILTTGYYLTAINHIIGEKGVEKTKLYFFSNDVEWIKKNIIPQLPEGLTYLVVDVNDNDTGYFDLYLISKCKHQISSNSSFGFWGGFLNRDEEKIVIVPEKWTPSTTGSSRDSDMAHRTPGWVVLPVDGGVRYEG